MSFEYSQLQLFMMYYHLLMCMYFLLVLFANALSRNSAFMFIKGHLSVIFYYNIFASLGIRIVFHKKELRSVVFSCIIL